MVMPVQGGTSSRARVDDHALPISSRAEAEGYVAMVCFKHGPPRLQGVELEWTVHHDDDPTRPVGADDLRRALGPHSPSTLDPGSPQRPLPGGSTVTLEPGGQLELSSAPHASLSGLLSAVRDDTALADRLLAATGLTRGSRALDPHRLPARLLQTPRYAAMQDAFERIGPHGVRMMCSTASLQVCLDAGEPHEVAVRWRAVHALAPALTALFANSPTAPAGAEPGWACARLRTTLATAPPATGAPEATDDPAAAYGRLALDAPLLCIRRTGAPWTAPSGASFADWIAHPSPGGPFGRPATWDDLDYHLTTVFPPVRPHGYLEVRYLDAQPGDAWRAPVALLCALMARPVTVNRVIEVTQESAGRWLPAARSGLSDPVLARAAAAVVDLGCAALGDTDLDGSSVAELAEALQRRLSATAPAQPGNAQPRNRRHRP